jgi:hypothetical protein
MVRGLQPGTVLLTVAVAFFSGGSLPFTWMVAAKEEAGTSVLGAQPPGADSAAEGSSPSPSSRRMPCDTAAQRRQVAALSMSRS